MKLPIKPYTAIALLCLTILLDLQYHLIFNTYELKNREYNFQEGNLLSEAYARKIRNDKIYPGGQLVIDTFINRNLPTLRQLQRQRKPQEFIRKGKLISDSIFRELRLRCNMDSVFNLMIKEENLSQNLDYLLTVEGLAVTFDGKTYHNLLITSEATQSHDTPFNSIYGVIIGGGLKTPNQSNRICYYTVSTPDPNTYQISFSLFADRKNRTLGVMKEMMPTFLLSLSSILLIIGIFYFTYRNWQKQKKLAEMKSDFLNSITHEFNTPLSTIMVANKSLGNPEITADSNNVRSLTEVIDRQTKRLHALINLALDITSMPKGDIEKEGYWLNTLLIELIEDYRIKSQGNAVVTFSASIPDKKVILNKFLFTTMLFNLFDNATKYNQSPIKTICIKTLETERGLCLAIKDNGIGIPTEIRMRIFEKFYRGKNQLGAFGLGLGLFYVQKNIEAHRWTLKISSEDGQGSEFLIFIPMKDIIIASEEYIPLRRGLS
ncbi:sensor histidine kinase [Desertivirga brevis]|uniref:sensor histidine kinase n=1 Tax=Desertivirga brevis TaxID=2810310 RepID=UPI001A95BEE9|nr:HAMP domain-containing sensor histidine kinase [Pedobacter sp. SYSU D00873]